MNDYLTAIHLQDLYSLTIYLNERDVSNTLIHNIRKQSTFMEVKLALIEMLLPRMPFDTVVYLSDNMDWLLENVKECPRNNFMTRNTNALMTCYQLYRLSQKAVARYARLQTRHKSFQSDMLELVSKVIE